MYTWIIKCWSSTSKDSQVIPWPLVTLVTINQSTRLHSGGLKSYHLVSIRLQCCRPTTSWWILWKVSPWQAAFGLQSLRWNDQTSMDINDFWGLKITTKNRVLGQAHCRDRWQSIAKSNHLKYSWSLTESPTISLNLAMGFGFPSLQRSASRVSWQNATPVYFALHHE